MAFTLKTYPECFLDKIPQDIFPLQVGGEVLSQVEGFKCFGVLLMSEGKTKSEIYRGIIVALAAMWFLHQTVVVSFVESLSPHSSSHLWSGLQSEEMGVSGSSFRAFSFFKILICLLILNLFK